MDKTKITSKLVSDSYYKLKHKSGLTIYVYPKEGYNSAYAILGTKYGSINNCFSVDTEKKITVPDGTAHFLEHKMFECKDGDAFLKYAKTGASANAYTSFDRTCYLFSCTEKFEESLRILLSFVSEPYFTDKTVAKEQGIIGQEIKMYDDSADWRVFFNLLESMYKNHPVKIDVAGTVDTIAQITADKLYEVYNVFYNLNNMVLCVCGNVTVEQISKIADDILKPCEEHKINNYFDEEPDDIVKPYVEQSFPVSMPLFNLGFKEKATRLLRDKESAQIDILLNMIASQTSPLYRMLLDAKLINNSFSYEMFEGPGYCSTIFSGESRAPKQAAELIKQYISKLKKDGLSKADFAVAQKAVYGDVVSSLNSVDSIANMLVNYHFTNNELFSYIDAVANTTFEDVCVRFTQMLDVNKTVLSVIRQQEE